VPRLVAGLDLQFFDSAVNQGQGEATRILQVVIGVESDGILTTAAAVKAINNVPAIVTAFTARREAVYKETANYQYFGTDWERRASEIGRGADDGVRVGSSCLLTARRRVLPSKPFRSPPLVGQAGRADK
jgi:lysozyme family protein